MPTQLAHPAWNLSAVSDEAPDADHGRKDPVQQVAGHCTSKALRFAGI
jgi:hypothetical protein